MKKNEKYFLLQNHFNGFVIFCPTEVLEENSEYFKLFLTPVLLKSRFIRQESLQSYKWKRNGSFVKEQKRFYIL